MSYLFSFSIYQTKYVVLLTSCLDNIDDVINFKIYLQSASKAMADWKKKRKTEIKKFEYLENENSFKDKLKNIFHSF